jgi:hypothetical protein
MNSSDPVGTVGTLWRFPVKSMLGEQVGVVEVGEGGIIGDRAYAVRDRQTGKVASAKTPKLWPGLLACRAAFVEPPLLGDELPPVRIDLADGDSVLSDASDADAVLSRFFGRDVELARAAQHGYTIDQYHPDEENYDPGGHRDEVVEARMGAALFDEMARPPAQHRDRRTPWSHSHAHPQPPRPHPTTPERACAAIHVVSHGHVPGR